MHSWGLVRFNYVFLLETIENICININIQTLHSNIHFTDLKTPKGGCLEIFHSCEHNR